MWFSLSFVVTVDLCEVWFVVTLLAMFCLLVVLNLRFVGPLDLLFGL